MLQLDEHTFPTTCPQPRFAPYRVAGRGGRVVPMRHEIRLCRLFRAEKGFPPSREALASAHHLDAVHMHMRAVVGCRLRSAEVASHRWTEPTRATIHPLEGEEGDTNSLQQGSTYILLTSTTSGGRSLHSTICE